MTTRLDGIESIRKIARMTATTCALLLATSALAQSATSNFDIGDGGWSPAPAGGTGIDYIAAGGNPGGFIEVTDLDNSWGYIEAPAAYRAFDAYGGTLSFDLFAFTSDPVSYPVQYGVRVGLIGGGLTLIAEAEDPPTDNWSSFTIPMVETGGWRIFSTLSQNYTTSAPTPTSAEMQAVMANLSGLFIATDYTAGTFSLGQIDRTSIDNVLLVAATDSDADGIVDTLDNCRLVANPAQRDTNADGFGNVCDPDLNDDDIVNATDLGLFKAVFFTTDADADFNGDGIVNAADLGTMKLYFFQPPGPGAG